MYLNFQRYQSISRLTRQLTFWAFRSSVCINISTSNVSPRSGQVISSYYREEQLNNSSPTLQDVQGRKSRNGVSIVGIVECSEPIYMYRCAVISKSYSSRNSKQFIKDNAIPFLVPFNGLFLKT